MSTLVLVRHGQASFGSDDYDNLSELGHEQSRRLGQLWSKRSVAFDRVYFGPKRRHRQTMEAARSPAWPDPACLEGLDEHHLLPLVKQHLPEVLEQAPDLASGLQKLQKGPSSNGLSNLVMEVARRWIEGRIAVAEIEPWQSFRGRVDEALATICDQADPGSRVVAFTSGGFMAAATGNLLELEHDKTLELAMALKNTGIVEILFTRGRRSVSVFNATPHLDDPALVTRL